MTLCCPECGPKAEIIVANIDDHPAARELDFRCDECGREPVVRRHITRGAGP